MEIHHKFVIVSGKKSPLRKCGDMMTEGNLITEPFEPNYKLNRSKNGKCLSKAIMKALNHY